MLAFFITFAYNRRNDKKGVLDMAQAVNVNFRLDEDVKKSMEAACSEMGLSMSAAFTIFAKTVAREKRIPFVVSAEPSVSKKRMMADTDKLLGDFAYDYERMAR
jgi:DNA-damage-inducible protein J